MLEPSKFSDKYQVRKLTRSDVAEVFSLCKGNPLYYRYCPPFVTEQSILDDMAALPKGKSQKDKYYVGFFDRNNLIAVMDLIHAYPDDSTAFIGFFMVSTLVQHRGIGSEIIEQLCRHLKNLGYEHIRLGWPKGDPQSEAFWKKNGFTETGASYEADGYTVIAAQKELSTPQYNGVKSQH